MYHQKLQVLYAIMLIALLRVFNVACMEEPKDSNTENSNFILG